MDDADLIAKIGRKRYRRRLERERYYTQGISSTAGSGSSAAISSPSPPLLSSSSSSNTSGGLNMSTTAAGNKLAKEIHDEFLTCKICLEGFKNPKCLDCLHTFCEQCIDNHVLSECTYKKYSDYREFTCPLCRKRTQLPVGGVKKLPDNFLVSSLGEVVARQKPSKFPFCDICKLINRKHREATSKCIDCNKLMCKPCVDMHIDTKVTQLHSIFDVEIEKDIECKEHQDEVVRFYCEPCESCICVLCTFNEHKDHEISQFSEAVHKYKENIQRLLSNCKGKIDIYDKQIALIDKCEGVVKAAEQRIRDAAIQFISDIRNKEKSLIEELHGMYGSELMDYVSRKNEMQNNLDSLKSTCNLTELVLKGKDIELLLLKRQVQEKLTTMAKVELKDLPPTIGKRILFVSGSLELGKLEDENNAIDKDKKKADEHITPSPGSNTNSNNISNDNNNSSTRREPQQPTHDPQRLTLPNMIFGRTERNRHGNLFDDDNETNNYNSSAAAHPPPVEQRTVNTQTEAYMWQAGQQQQQQQQQQPPPSAAPAVRMVNRAIMVDIPDPRYCDETYYSRGSHGLSQSGMQNRATGTDIVSTVEKAVNTKPRSLHSMTASPSQTENYSPSGGGDNNNSSSGLDPSGSPVPQRHRRRRERARAAEASSRSAVGQDSSEGYGVPVLTYSSSIDDGYVGAEGGGVDGDNCKDGNGKDSDEDVGSSTACFTVENCHFVVKSFDAEEDDDDKGNDGDESGTENEDDKLNTRTTNNKNSPKRPTDLGLNVGTNHLNTSSMFSSIIADVQTPETVATFSVPVPQDVISVETTTFNTVAVNTNSLTYQNASTSPPRFKSK